MNLIMSIVCTARETAHFFADYPVLKPIRGQVSWVNNQAQPLSQNIAYSYGGYCMQLDAEHLILGASFYPGRDDAEVLAEDHVHNYELIHSVFPEYAQSLACYRDLARSCLGTRTKSGLFPPTG